uniref:Uncharacterized protein n=1 Tax=Haptolina brevifila TaxID=156173 RepID=A0A7S2CL23_9EUKA
MHPPFCPTSSISLDNASLQLLTQHSAAPPLSRRATTLTSSAMSTSLAALCTLILLISQLLPSAWRRGTHRPRPHAHAGYRAHAAHRVLGLGRTILQAAACE